MVLYVFLDNKITISYPTFFLNWGVIPASPSTTEKDDF